MEGWVRTRTKSGDSSLITEVTNSSGEKQEIKLLISSLNGESKVGRVSGILTTDEHGSPLNLGIDNEDVATAAIHSLESKIYTTPLLMRLKNSISIFEDLLKVVIRETVRKTNTTSVFVPENPPNCNVYCVRIGTIIPVYACSDDVLNCGNCGVDGVYILGGYGCTLICSLHCNVFYPVV